METTTVTPDKKTPAPEDVAARDFESQLPSFKNLSVGMSNKALRRVLNALVEFPLQEGKVKLTGQKEELLFSIGLHLIDCKMTMFQAVLLERIKTEQEKKENGS